MLRKRQRELSGHKKSRVRPRLSVALRVSAFDVTLDVLLEGGFLTVKELHFVACCSRETHAATTSWLQQPRMLKASIPTWTADLGVTTLIYSGLQLPLLWPNQLRHLTLMQPPPTGLQLPSFLTHLTLHSLTPDFAKHLRSSSLLSLTLHNCVPHAACYPDSLQSLVLRGTGPAFISVDEFLPTSLTSLDIDTREKDRSATIVCLRFVSLSLRRLRVGPSAECQWTKEFETCLSHQPIKQSLQSLELHNVFGKLLLYSTNVRKQFPLSFDSLRHLRLGSALSQGLLRLPAGLETFMAEKDCDQQLVLPPSLRILVLSDNYSQKVIVPPHLTALYVSAKAAFSLDLSRSQSLRWLRLESCMPLKIPASVDTLVLTASTAQCIHAMRRAHVAEEWIEAAGRAPLKFRVADFPLAKYKL